MAHAPTPPSIHLLVEVLARNLLPDPLLPCLASTLNLYAHLILFSRQLSDDAEQILSLHNSLLKDNESSGVRDVEALVGERGCLTEVEGPRVNDVKRRSVEKMFRLSVEIRKHHIARLLSTRGALLSRAHTLIDHYFPEFSVEEKSYKQHPHLHISSMTRPEAKMIADIRKQVLSWVVDAEKVLAADDFERPLRYDIFIPGQFKASVHAKALAESMCVEARRVIRDAEDIQAILANDGSWDWQAYAAELENRGKMKEQERKRKEKVRRRHTFPAQLASHLPAPASSRGSTVSPFTEASPPAVPLTPPPARHRARESLPQSQAGLHGLFERGPSPEPTPDHVNSLPRLSFSTGKRKSLGGPSSISRSAAQVKTQETPSHAALLRHGSGPPINWKVKRERFSYKSSDNEDSGSEKEVVASIVPTKKASPAREHIRSPRFVPSSTPPREFSSPMPPPTRPPAKTVPAKAAAGSSRLAQAGAVAGPSRIPASSLPVAASGKANKPETSERHQSPKKQDVFTPSGPASKRKELPASGSAGASSKKRVRQSYGLEGPDFTAPVSELRLKKKAKPRATG